MIKVSHTCVRVLAISVHNIFRVIHHDDVYYLLGDTDRVVCIL